MPNHRPKPRHHPLYGFKLFRFAYTTTILSCRSRQCRWQFRLTEEEDLETILTEAIAHRLQCNHPIQSKNSLAYSTVLETITVHPPKPGNSS